jgi:hypothetical protein
VLTADNSSHVLTRNHRGTTRARTTCLSFCASRDGPSVCRRDKKENAKGHRNNRPGGWIIIYLDVLHRSGGLGVGAVAAVCTDAAVVGVGVAAGLEPSKGPLGRPEAPLGLPPDLYIVGLMYCKAISLIYQRLATAAAPTAPPHHQQIPSTR